MPFSGATSRKRPASQPSVKPSCQALFFWFPIGVSSLVDVDFLSEFASEINVMVQVPFWGGFYRITLEGA